VYLLDVWTNEVGGDIITVEHPRFCDVNRAKLSQMLLH